MLDLIEYVVLRVLILAAVFGLVVGGLAILARPPAKPEPTRLEQYVEEHDIRSYRI